MTNSELDQWLLQQRQTLLDRLKVNCDEANKIGDGLIEVEKALRALAEKRGQRMEPIGSSTSTTRPRLRLVK